MSLLVVTLSGATRCLDFASNSVSVHDVKLRLQELEGVPWEVQTLISNRSVLDNQQVLEMYAEMPPLRMMLGLQGGKGGFGALLRSTKAKAGQKRMDNNSACRDLNGRRLRHVQAEKKLLEWKPTQVKHRELQAKFSKIRKGTDRRRKDEFEVDTDESSQRFLVTFRYNKDMLQKFKAAISQEDRTFVKFSQQWLVKLNAAATLGEFILKHEWTFSETARMWIWGASGPESISRNRQAFKLRNLRRGFSQIPTNGDALEADMRDSVQSGLSLLKRKQAAQRLEERKEATKRAKIADEDDEDDAEEDDADPFTEFVQLKAPTDRAARVTPLEPEPATAPSSTRTSAPPQVPPSTPTPAPTPSTPTPASSGPSAPQEPRPSLDAPAPVAMTVAAPPVPKEWPPIDLRAIATSAELEAFGLEHLKHELQRQGLKCGGSLSQRAERLLLLKNTPLDKLDKKYKANIVE